LRRRDLHPGDWQGRRDLVEQALRQSGVDFEVRADANFGGSRQVHDVVAVERVSSETAQPPRELLHIDHLQPHRRIAGEEDDARDTAQLIEKTGRKAVTVPGDIPDEAHRVSIVQKAVSDLGGLDN
jgi:hypothetical protein